MTVLSGHEPGKLRGRFATNIIKDLKVAGDKPAFLMVTGRVRWNAKLKKGAVEPSRSVVYVMDQNSGRWAAYGFGWNVTKGKAGVFQEGPLKKLFVGAARAMAE